MCELRRLFPLSHETSAGPDFRSVPLGYVVSSCSQAHLDLRCALHLGSIALPNKIVAQLNNESPEELTAWGCDPIEWKRSSQSS